MSQLHKVNLIAGEQPIGQPERNGDAVQPSGGDVVSAGCGRGQADGADHLRRHPSLAAQLFHPRLHGEGESRDRADQQQAAVVAVPQQSSDTRRSQQSDADTWPS